MTEMLKKFEDKNTGLPRADYDEVSIGFNNDNSDNPGDAHLRESRPQQGAVRFSGNGHESKNETQAGLCQR
jgi:hypothetical protein